MTHSHVQELAVVDGLDEDPGFFVRPAEHCDIVFVDRGEQWVFRRSSFGDQEANYVHVAGFWVVLADVGDVRPDARLHAIRRDDEICGDRLATVKRDTRLVDIDICDFGTSLQLNPAGLQRSIHQLLRQRRSGRKDAGGLLRFFWIDVLFRFYDELALRAVDAVGVGRTRTACHGVDAEVSETAVCVGCDAECVADFLARGRAL